MTERLRRVTGGFPVAPLVILFALFFFDEFDTAAFNVLAPDIKHTFHLSDHGFALLVIGNLSVILLAAVPLGYYGDRLKRTRLVWIGAIIAGIFSFLTGFAGSIAVLAAYRLGNGMGRLVNDPIHSSLLADYYQPASRPAVFTFHRNAERMAQVVGPAVAGIAAYIAGWRAAFVILIVPITITAIISLRLKEPVRGITDDAEAAAIAIKEPPIPLAESRRMIFAVPTLSRQFTAFFFIGAGLVPLAFLAPLFLQRAFGVGDLGRGLFVSLDGAAAVAGIAYSGRQLPKLAAKHLGEPMRVAGFSLVAVGIGVALTAVAPYLWLAVLLALVTSFAGGIFTPPFVNTIAFVTPARVRSLSFSWAALFLLAGVWILYIFIPLSRVADSDGIRDGLAVTAPYWVIGGLIMASAKKYVPADAAAALKNFASLSVIKAERRRLEEAGDTGVLLTCHGLTAGYNGVQVLFGVDFEVHAGEIVALLGTNGAGKSTVLKAITGLLDPTGGLVVFDGRDITHADPLTTSGLGIAQMPGGRGTFPTLTVEENLSVAAWRIQDRGAESRAVDEVYELFPRLKERRTQLAGNMSGGEQQQLALGMAFMTKPRLLLIDELSLGLSPVVVESLVENVKRINRTGVAVVVVEQSLNVALSLASRAYFLEKGEVRFHGPTEELLDQDDIVRSVFLAGAATGKAKTRKRAAAPEQRLELDLRPALAAEDVSVNFGGVKALTDVTMSVAKGEILGIVGPNGAGKTTLFDVLSGFVSPSKGKVLLESKDVTSMRPDERSKLGLGRSFQDARIFTSLTVAENLATAFERHLSFRDHFADAIGLPAVRGLEEDIAYAVSDLVELMRLDAFRDKFVGDLSTGSRRIVDLAMALAHDPNVLILDEPSSGIAQKETEALVPLLKRIRDETNCALIVIEHDMPMLASVSDRLIAMDQGQVIATGKPREVLDNPTVVASYLGGDPAAINRSGAATPKKPAPAKRAAPKPRTKAKSI